MNVSTYDSIWNNIIVPIYENISREDCNVRLKRGSKEKIFNKYVKFRDEIKNKYMEDPAGNVDRHKIASLMMKAIEIVYPIKISKRYLLYLWKNDEVLDKRYTYANETLALYVALSILENYKDYGIDGKLEMQRKSIEVPHTFNDSDYVMNTCIDLYFGKRSKNINVLTFSNVFFLLEKLANDVEAKANEECI